MIYVNFQLCANFWKLIQRIGRKNYKFFCYLFICMVYYKIFWATMIIEYRLSINEFKNDVKTLTFLGFNDNFYVANALMRVLNIYMWSNIDQCNNIDFTGLLFLCVIYYKWSHTLPGVMYTLCKWCKKKVVQSLKLLY